MLRIFDKFFLHIGLESGELCAINWKSRAALYSGMTLGGLLAITFFTTVLLDIIA